MEKKLEKNRIGEINAKKKGKMLYAFLESRKEKKKKNHLDSRAQYIAFRAKIGFLHPSIVSFH